MPVYDKKYMKAKVRKFNGVIKTNLSDEIPKERIHYICIACIIIDSVMRMQKKKNYLQVYLEECEYRMKKTKIPKFIDVELKSESELESGTELESKSEWKFGTE